MDLFSHQLVTVHFLEMGSGSGEWGACWVARGECGHCWRRDVALPRGPLRILARGAVPTRRVFRAPQCHPGGSLRALQPQPPRRHSTLRAPFHPPKAGAPTGLHRSLCLVPKAAKGVSGQTWGLGPGVSYHVGFGRSPSLCAPAPLCVTRGVGCQLHCGSTAPSGHTLSAQAGEAVPILPVYQGRGLCLRFPNGHGSAVQEKSYMSRLCDCSFSSSCTRKRKKKQVK